MLLSGLKHLVEVADLCLPGLLSDLLGHVHLLPMVALSVAGLA